MKTNVKRELIICIITLMLLALTITQTFASQTMTDVNEIGNLIAGDTNQLTNEDALNILEGQNRNNTTRNNTAINNTTKNNTAINNAKNNTTNNTKNNNVNNSNKNELPDTGLDTPSITIVAICVVSAIYAYKKIRDYNNI